MKKIGAIPVMLFAGIAIHSLPAHAGTWSSFVNAPPSGFSNCLLLTDGTVIGSDGGNRWFKLTPDIHGSYRNGTWTQLASTVDTRLYYSSMVLPNGNVYVAGGEYGTGGSDARAEIYNPLTNTWTFSSAMPFTATDAEAILLPNGNVLQTNSQSTTAQYNPNTNTWSNVLNGPDTNETDWQKLPDDSILQITSYGRNTARYIPSSGTWVNDATLPVDLFGYGGELGAGHLLPNGKVFWLGATSNTAIYTPTGNTNPGSWVAGPVIPGGLGQVDSSSAMMVDGKILCAVGPSTGFDSPTYFYEYDYVSNSFNQVNAPNGTTSDNTGAYTTSMLDLPDGTVLYQGTGLYIYTPSGAQIAAGRPTIKSVLKNSDGTYTLTGYGLNGISAGAKYGDDKEMNSNYPIIRLTNTSNGNVYYARTYGWSSTGMMTGSRVLSTNFTTPSGLPSGTYSLVVSANGIASYPVTFSSTAVFIATASENQTVAFTTPVDVAYGANGGYLYQFAKSGNITFSNTAFGGDPAFGIGKTGFYMPFTQCASEGGSYTFTLPVEVGYGANGKYNYNYGTSGTVTFNNATFGDPIVGVGKAGYYMPYNMCAVENEVITFPTATDLAYGANGHYVFRHAFTGTITFNNATFGDPISGTVKAGYYRPSH